MRKLVFGPRLRLMLLIVLAVLLDVRLLLYSAAWNNVTWLPWISRKKRCNWPNWRPPGRSDCRQRIPAPHRPAAVARDVEKTLDGLTAMNTRWCYTYRSKGAAVMFNCRRPEYLIGKRIWTEYRESVGQPFQLACQRTMHEQVPIPPPSNLT